MIHLVAFVTRPNLAGPPAALGAILFLYRHVLKKDLGSLDAVRASKPKRLPTVLSKEEVRRLITAMPEKGAHRLIIDTTFAPSSSCWGTRMLKRR